jgi:hypothetical protein
MQRFVVLLTYCNGQSVVGCQLASLNGTASDELFQYSSWVRHTTPQMAECSAEYLLTGAVLFICCSNCCSCLQATPEICYRISVAQNDSYWQTCTESGYIVFM